MERLARCEGVQATAEGGAELRKEESGRLLLEGGQERVTFRLKICMDKLEATFNYEAASVSPLAILSVQVSSTLSIIKLFSHNC